MSAAAKKDRAIAVLVYGGGLGTLRICDASLARRCDSRVTCKRAPLSLRAFCKRIEVCAAFQSSPIVDERPEPPRSMLCPSLLRDCGGARCAAGRTDHSEHHDRDRRKAKADGNDGQHVLGSMMQYGDRSSAIQRSGPLSR